MLWTAIAAFAFVFTALGGSVINKETLSYTEAPNLLALAFAFFNPGESYKTLDI